MRFAAYILGRSRDETNHGVIARQQTPNLYLQTYSKWKGSYTPLIFSQLDILAQGSMLTNCCQVWDTLFPIFFGPLYPIVLPD